MPNASGGLSEYQLLWSNLSDTGVTPIYEADTYCNPGNSTPPPDNSLFKSQTQYEKTCTNNPKFNPIVLSQIILPNNQSYLFNYNVYGEIVKVTLPGGGYQRYVYGELPAIDNDLQNKLYGQANRGVISKYVSASGTGGDEVGWAYSATMSISPFNPSTYSVIARNPDDGIIDRKLYLSASNLFGLEDPRYGFVYEEQYRDKRGNPNSFDTEKWLQRVLRKYDVITVAGPGGINSLRKPHLKKQVNILFASENIVNDRYNDVVFITDIAYDVDLNLTSRKLYNYNTTFSPKSTSIDSFYAYWLLRQYEYIYLVNDPDITQVTRNEYRNLNLIALCTKELVKGDYGYIVSATQYKYDETGYAIDPYGTITGWIDPQTSNRGNITSVRKWLNHDGYQSSSFENWTKGIWVENHSWYDQAGNIVKTKDANNNESTYNYADNFESEPSHSTYAFQTSFINALGYSSLSKYDYLTGLLIENTDANGITARNEYHDPLNRITRTIKSVGTPLENQESTSYKDDENRVIRTNSNNLKNEVIHDRLGRVIETRKYENESTYVSSFIEYDIPGRSTRTSTPLKLGEVTNWTTTRYDILGRITDIATSDGAASHVIYNGNHLFITDQGDMVRRVDINPFGQVIGVTENPFGQPTTYTRYEYDFNGNLRSAYWPGGPKFYQYDSLSRLYSENNAERGVTAYKYDANGNVNVREDSRGVKTLMTWDALNRITTKTYTGTIPSAITIAQATPPVIYTYDDYSKLPSGSPSLSGGAPVGRLIGVTSGGGADGTYLKYDSLGRIEINYQRTNSIDYPSSYTYNLSGNVTAETRKERTILSNYDNAGRLTGLDTPTTPEAKSDNILNDITYTTSGNIKSEILGNGLIHSITYNERDQPSNIRLGSIDNPESILRIENIYGTMFENTPSNPYVLYKKYNNGNIARINYYIDGILQHSQTYLYDRHNRLKYAVEHNDQNYTATPTWYQTFDYDTTGNRGINVSKSSSDNNTALQLSDFYYYSTRITRMGYIYDYAGNLTSEPGMTHTYDAENRIISTSILSGGPTINYSYDGNGRRIKKEVSGVNSIFTYGANGELLAEYNSLNGTVLKEYIYRAGELFAVKEPALNFKFITNDYFGSPAVFTNWEGEVIPGGRHEYMPFGEEITVGYGNRKIEQGYTPSRTQTQVDGLQIQYRGKVRDIETGLDWFGNRYYRNTHGRFLSPNTMDIRLTDPVYPQQWNKYVFSPNQLTR